MGISNKNQSIGDNGLPLSDSSTQVGGSDGTNLQTPRVYDVDQNVTTEFVLGAVLRASAPGGSVEAGTTTNPIQTSSPDLTATAALGALNATVTLAIAGRRSAGLQLSAGTLIGTLVPEVSLDNGTTFVAAFFANNQVDYTSTLVFTAANTATTREIPLVGGVTHVRVRVSAFTSGTASARLSASQAQSESIIAAPADGFKRTYAASIALLNPGAVPTDIFTITGAAGVIVRVTKILFSGIRSANANDTFLILRRSTANAGGTLTILTAVPADTRSMAASAVVRAYTAPPATGALVGQVQAVRVHLPTAGSFGSLPYTFEFGTKMASTAILQGAGEVLALNQNGVTIAGSSFNISIEWTEEPAN